VRTAPTARGFCHAASTRTPMVSHFHVQGRMGAFSTRENSFWEISFLYFWSHFPPFPPFPPPFPPEPCVGDWRYRCHCHGDTIVFTCSNPRYWHFRVGGNVQFWQLLNIRGLGAKARRKDREEAVKKTSEVTVPCPPLSHGRGRDRFMQLSFLHHLPPTVMASEAVCP